MTYEQRPVGKQKVRRDSENEDNPLVYQLIIDGLKVTPSGATITITQNGQDDALITADAMTVDSGTLMTYEVDTTEEDDWPVGSYRAVLVITADSIEYTRHFFFDVVPYLFDPSIGFDQLVALDDGIRMMQHDSDPQFAALIESCKSVLKTRLEAKVVKDRKLVQEMIIDHSGLATAAQFYILYRIYAEKRDREHAMDLKEEYEELWEAVLSTIRYDVGLSGSEPAEEGGLDETRFIT